MHRFPKGVLAMVALLGLAASAALAGDKHKHEAKHEGHEATAEIGKPAPDFELKGQDGKTYKLSDFKNQIVVLEWFNKDCPVVVEWRERMAKLQAAYAEKGVVWLAIDSSHMHTDKDNVEAAKDMKVHYPILSDFDGKTGHAYGARTTPHMYVIHKGTLVYMGAIAERKGDKNYVAEALDAILAGKPVQTSSTKPFGCSVKYKKV